MTKTAVQPAAPAGAVQAFSNDTPEWLKKGNRGSEDVSAKDMTLPRIDVLQALSPQIKKTDPAYIQGAEQGTLYNTVTQELYPEGVIFVPCVFRKEFVIWKDRKKGGGFFGAFPTEVEAAKHIKTLESPGDYEAVETHQHFGMALINGKRQQLVLSMSKSKLKVSRKLNTFVQMSEADRFAKAYKIGAIEDKSDRGEFYNFSIVQLGWVDKETYEDGEKLYNIVKAGEVDVVRDEQAASATSTAGSTVEDL